MEAKVAAKVVKDKQAAELKKCATEKDADKKTACEKKAKYAGVVCADLKTDAEKKACTAAGAQALVASMAALFTVAALV